MDASQEITKSKDSTDDAGCTSSSISYDYNALLQSIELHRSKAYASSQQNKNLNKEKEKVEIDIEELSLAINDFAKLANYCSLTPHLWLTYASDAATLVRVALQSAGDDEEQTQIVQESSLEISVETLKLAVTEFPGCAKLRLKFLHQLVLLQLAKSSSLLVSLDDDDNGNHNNNDKQCWMIDEEEHEEISKMFERAVSELGSGSHPNSEHVANIWRLYAEYMALYMNIMNSNSNKNDNNPSTTTTLPMANDCVAKLLTRRACLPLHSSDDLTGEVAAWSEGHSVLPSDLALPRQFLPATTHFNNFGAAVDVSILPEYLYRSSTTTTKRATETLTLPLGQAIEYGRREASRSFLKAADVVRYENEVHEMMCKDAIVDAADLHSSNSDGDGYYSNHLPLMGYASQQTASAFISYAQMFGKKNNINKKSNNNQKCESLSVYVFERGIAECITHEGIWSAFIYYLLREKRYEMCANVCRRACRNCPYSLQLFKLHMQATAACMASMQNLKFNSNSQGYEYEYGDTQSSILAIAQSAVELHFLERGKEDYLEIYMEYCRTIRREFLRVAFLFLRASDDESSASSSNIKSKQEDSMYSKEVTSILFNLASDLREAFDVVDTFLRDAYPDWKVGHVRLWRERAHVELYIIEPISSITSNDSNVDSSSNNESDRCFKRVTNIDAANPVGWKDAVALALSHVYVTSNMQSDQHQHQHYAPRQSAAALRTAIHKSRGMYHKALNAICKEYENEKAKCSAKNSSLNDGHLLILAVRKSNLQSMCNDFLSFERTFGTAEQYMKAVKLIRGKIRGCAGSRLALSANLYEVLDGDSSASMMVDTVDVRASTSIVDTNIHMDVADADVGNTATATKRALDDGVNEKGEAGMGTAQRESKRPRKDSAEENTMDNYLPKTASTYSKDNEIVVQSKRTDLKVEKLKGVHPYTVKITNIPVEAEDMDLVDAFKKRCGNIVHARIIREKGRKGRSKGEGLVQFEEKESVEKALLLSETVGIHEKLICVVRSHLPAISLVPAGRHRVVDKGIGKKSKLNAKKAAEKERHIDVLAVGTDVDGDAKMVDQMIVEEVNGNDTLKKEREPSNQNRNGSPKEEQPKHISAAPKEKKKSSNSLLAFRPRGVARKTKVALNAKADN